MLELATLIGIISTSGKWGIGGGGMILGRRIERRKSKCYHRRGKPAGGRRDMTWKGNLVFATQFAYTNSVSVMLQNKTKRQREEGDTAGTIKVLDCERWWFQMTKRAEVDSRCL